MLPYILKSFNCKKTGEQKNGTGEKKFFNALSSPLMIRIHFDVLWTMIADTLYHRLAKDLRRFEAQLAPAIFRKFINMPGKIAYAGKKFIVKIRKRAHTPVLMGVEKLEKPFPVPWLNNTTIEIRWTA